MLIPPDRQDEEAAILESIKRGAHIHHYETVRQRKDGSLAEISLTVSPISIPEGTSSERQRSLATFPIARKANSYSFANWTIERKTCLQYFKPLLRAPAAEIKYVLNDRLQALARAYRMIAEGGCTSLAAILEREVGGFSTQVTFGGCDIIANPSAVQQLALIIHELATNALKYGALGLRTTSYSQRSASTLAARLRICCSQNFVHG
jgi:hypothetical protein